MTRLSSSLSRIAILVVVVLVVTTSPMATTFGINAHVPDGPVLDRVTEAGIGWVRIDFVWSLVETERDVYQWDLYDALLPEIEARGLRVLANFHGTPAWATGGNAFSGVPDDPNQVREFLYLAAKRYRGRIDAWGIWNEPNLDRFWEGSRSQYIDSVLLPASAGVRAADGEALVTAPDTAHLSSGHWDEWLRDVIREAGDAIDVLSHHVYPSDGRAIEVTKDLVEKPRFPWEEPSVRQVLDESGWSRRPFWLTETGVQSVKHGYVAQSDFYENLLEDWFGPDPEAQWVDRIFFYEVHDPPSPTPWSFGILWSHPDLVRKASFFAYRDFIAGAMIDDAEVVARDVPANVSPGEMLDLRITFRNTGTTVWRGSEEYGLHITSDDWWWTDEPSRIPPGDEIHPGETVELSFSSRSPLFTVAAQRSVATFDIRVADGNGRPFGNPARVTIISSPLDRAEIVAQPYSTTVPEGWRAVFTLRADGPGSLDYQWRRNGVPLTDDEQISGSRTARLEVFGVDRHLEGDYDCIVQNAAGPVVSETAVLTIGDNSPRRIGPGDRRLPSAASGTKRGRAIQLNRGADQFLASQSE